MRLDVSHALRCIGLHTEDYRRWIGYLGQTSLSSVTMPDAANDVNYLRQVSVFPAFRGSQSVTPVA